MLIASSSLARPIEFLRKFQLFTAPPRPTSNPTFTLEAKRVDNARRDRVVKRQVYGRFGVKEYWIIDPEKRAIETYQLKKHTLVLAGAKMDEDEIRTRMLPDLVFEAQDVFKR